MGLFDLPGFEDFMDDYLKDGTNIGGDLFYQYDAAHKMKVRELLDKDRRYFYLIQKKCGIDLDDESFYGPDTDLRIVNVDHFAIKASAKDKLDEIRTLIYNVIDWVYANQDEIDLDEEV